jgi:hypothetical protein
MSKKIEQGLRHHAGDDADIRFERVAVTPAQIEAWDLPSRPTKREGNTHARAFDGDSVELDAIPAAQLRLLVREVIERHVDMRQLAILKQAEKSERSLLAKWAGQMPLTRRRNPQHQAARLSVCHVKPAGFRRLHRFDKAIGKLAPSGMRFNFSPFRGGDWPGDLSSAGFSRKLATACEFKISLSGSAFKHDHHPRRSPTKAGELQEPRRDDAATRRGGPW